MPSARVRSLIYFLDSVVYCSACKPAVPVEISARIFYRLKDDDSVSCPNGHHGTLRDYKHAVAHPGRQSGPFILYQHGETTLRVADEAD